MEEESHWRVIGNRFSKKESMNVSMTIPDLKKSNVSKEKKKTSEIWPIS